MKALPNPCNTCPYRKDTPPGIWDKSEYDKLPEWDEQWGGHGTFMCHNDTKKETVCRGWLEVHQRNFHSRLAQFKIEWTEENKKQTTVPLYESGAAARRAGIKGIKRPSIKARIKIQQLSRKKKLNV